MENFVDPSSNRPITDIRIKAGETKVVGLKLPRISYKPYLTMLPHGDDVLRNIDVFCEDDGVAFSRQVLKLARAKSAYEDHYDMEEIDTEYVERAGTYYFQICGRAAGVTKLKVVVDNSPDYAPAVSVVVTDNSKQLVLNPPIPFTQLWAKHPYKDSSVPYDRRSHPCPLPIKGQCMIRLCKALGDAGVSFRGFFASKCGGGGPTHDLHFTNPYDFIPWKNSGFYSWTAKPPFQAEPMPGLAAWPFIASKTGIVLFMHYFAVGGSMWGGHIDLWDGERMGNNLDAQTPETGEGLGAFLRAQTIYFWPLQ